MQNSLPSGSAIVIQAYGPGDDGGSTGPPIGKAAPGVQPKCAVDA